MGGFNGTLLFFASGELSRKGTLCWVNSIVASVCSGVLHISNISQARVSNIASVFSIGEEVKVMVIPSSKRNKLSLRYYSGSFFMLANRFLHVVNTQLID